jgi:hypothetical protein
MGMNSYIQCEIRDLTELADAMKRDLKKVIPHAESDPTDRAHDDAMRSAFGDLGQD